MNPDHSGPARPDAEPEQASRSLGDPAPAPRSEASTGIPAPDSAPTAAYGDDYDADYYAHGCGRPYRRDEVWMRFFQGVADRIVESIAPASVLDAGCAMGFLVETLRNRGVESFGVDISEYAIGQAHESIREHVRVGSITEPFPRERYDLITCVEVLEHMPARDAAAAIANLCAHGDDILFSSSPDDHRELTHLNVQPAEHWAELFAQQGFYRDLDFDASFLTPWAQRFRRGEPGPKAARLVRHYERRLSLLAAENEGRRAVAVEMRDELMAKDRQLGEQRELIAGMDDERGELDLRLVGLIEERDNLAAQVGAWKARWHALETSPGWGVLSRLQLARDRVLEPGSLRERLFLSSLGWLRITRERGPLGLAGHFWREGRAMTRYRLGERKRRRQPDEIARLDIPPVRLPQDPPELDTPVDIIVCIHNALEDVKRCLEALERFAPPPARLILIDDGSEAETAAWLADWVAARSGAGDRAANAATAIDGPESAANASEPIESGTSGAGERALSPTGFARPIILRRSEEATGYTFAVNRGLALAEADWMVTLNSDTIVTAGWLERMLACGGSDERIGMVGPLSNAATYQSIPHVRDDAGQWAVNELPEGVSVEEMGALVANDSGQLYPRMPFLNGFCLMLRRSMLEALGGFDEAAFGAGYGEENDLALRARKAGWQLALADDAYVYHAMSRSYSHERRQALETRAGEALAAKHGTQAIVAGEAYLRGSRTLQGIRSRSRVLAEREHIVLGGRDRFAGRRVLFVLPLAAAGGGASIAMFEMRAMRRMGAHVALFNLEVHREAFEAAYPDLDIPVIYGRRQDLVTIAHDWDALVATMYTTVEWLQMAARGASDRTVFGYFVQDVEAYFYPVGSNRFHAALDSYLRMPEIRIFTMTPWNAEELKRLLDVDCNPVMPGYDTEFFRPRPKLEREGLDPTAPRDPDRPLRITAMIRPPTPFRAPRLTMEVMQEMARRHGPRVEMVIFGVEPEEAGFADLPRDFPFRLTGRLNPRQMARLLNDADVFLDFSDWQGMGMTAMEAMVCGCATVVTRYGGPPVYARHEVNCLMVDTRSKADCLQAVDRLIQDADLRRRLGEQGMRDIPLFYPERAAWNMLNELFGPEIDATMRAEAEQRMKEDLDAIADPGRLPEASPFLEAGTDSAPPA